MWPIKASTLWSIGEFRPVISPGTEEHRVEAALFRFLSERLSSFTDVGVRSPKHQYSLARGNQVMAWHRDGPWDDQYLALWSNSLGTEIRLDLPGRQTIYQVPPWEVWLVNNKLLVHRTPRFEHPQDVRNRWFARGHMNLSAKVNDVPDVSALTLD